MILKTGDIVECEFLDHVEDGGEPYRFKVWGILAVKGRMLGPSKANEVVWDVLDL